MNSFKKEFAKIEWEYKQNPKDPLMERIKLPEDRVVIFGASTIGYSVAETTNAFEGKLAAFCDTYKAGKCSTNFNVPIISPEQLKSDYGDAAIVIACSHKYSDEIFEQVINLGFPKSQIFKRDSDYTHYRMEQIKQHLNGYEWAYEFFKDDISRKILLDRIRGYLFYFEMDHSICNDIYFEKDLIKLSDDEVFVDGGSYTGDTILEFIHRANGKYSHIYGFEPENGNYERARGNLEGHSNISLNNMALWDRNCTLNFSQNGGGSTIDNGGKISVPVTSLDIFFAEKPKDMLPTFIKLDIEGAEKRAIIGAGNVIREAHPKLAICVYHKPEDIYELPQLIDKYGKYNFALRHYAKGYYETVLYAV